MIARHTPENSI